MLLLMIGSGWIISLVYLLKSLTFISFFTFLFHFSLSFYFQLFHYIWGFINHIFKGLIIFFVVFFLSSKLFLQHIIYLVRIISNFIFFLFYSINLHSLFFYNYLKNYIRLPLKILNINYFDFFINFLQLMKLWS